MYNMAITNSGPQAQWDNAGPEFVDVLPFGYVYIGATATSGTLSDDSPTRTLSWSGPVAVGQVIGFAINGSIDPAVSGATLSNQATLQFDADGNGSNEATALSDDPSVGGGADPTVISIGQIQAVPATNLLALILLALRLGRKRYVVSAPARLSDSSAPTALRRWGLFDVRSQRTMGVPPACS